MRFYKIYNIDFRALANLLTPVFLRTRKHIDWILVLLNPLRDVNFSFNKFRNDSIYRVTHNGQVYSLQAVLNDAYDKTERRIKIVDSLFIEPVYVYPEDDEKPVYIYPENQGQTYVYDNSVFEESELDFIVLIPSDIKPFSENDTRILEIQIRSLVNYYKLASKRYELRWI